MLKYLLNISVAALLSAVMFPVFSQGKIKLKRPTSGEESATGAAGKITLTKPGAAGSAPTAPEEDYSTSRGPESKSRTLYFGLFGGFNIAGPTKSYSVSTDGLSGATKTSVEDAQAKGGSWELSPMIGLRSELYFKRVYGIVLDLGYQQNRSYAVDQQTTFVSGVGQVPAPTTGYLRTDYAVARLMFSYRYSLYKVVGKVKFLRPVAEFLKPFAGNLQLGGYVKTPLSAQLEILDPNIGNPNDPFYDVKEFTRPVSAGIAAGLGFEVRFASAIFFFEGQYFRGLIDSYNDIRSRYFNSEKFTEQGIYFSSGIKMGIYGF